MGKLGFIEYLENLEQRTCIILDQFFHAEHKPETHHDREAQRANETSPLVQYRNQPFSSLYDIFSSASYLPCLF